MGPIISNPLVQRLFVWVASWLFSKLSDYWQDFVAHQRVEIHVKSTIKKYEALILKYDELHDSGKLTDNDKEELRLEKIRLEEDLINNIRR